ERLPCCSAHAAAGVPVALSASPFYPFPVVRLAAQLLSGPFPFSVPWALWALSYSFNCAPTFSARPHAPAIGQDLVGEAGMFFTVLADDRDIRDVDWSFFLDDTAFDVALGVRPRVALDHLDAFDHDLLILRDDDQNASSFAPVLAAQDVDLVVLFDWRHCRHLDDLRSQ